MARQSSTTQDFTVSGSTQFHALYGTVFDTFIRANGWTYVSQTGDGDPSSVSPGVAGTYACFRLYSTTVSSETWYIRVDFGYTTNGPSIKLQVGSGNNGSGTLTGQTSTQQTFAFTSANLSTNRFYAISSVAGRLTFAAGFSNSGSAGNLWFFVIHGGVDGTGALSTGFDLFQHVGNSVYAVQNVPVSGTVPAAQALIPCNGGNTVSNVIGTHTMTFHSFLWNESGGLNPSPALMFGGTTDFPSAGVIVTTPLYGSSRDFLAMGQLLAMLSNNLRFGLLYE